MSESPSSGPGRLVVVVLAIVAVAVAFFALRGADDAAPTAAPDAPVAAPAAAPPSDVVMSPDPNAPPEPALEPEAVVLPEGTTLGGDATPAVPIPMGNTIDDEPLELPEIPWEDLPEGARDEAFEASLETLSDWVAELDPEYDAQLLGIDCSAPPCVVGMAFDGTSFGDDHTAKAGFQNGFAEELTRLRSVRPAMTMVTATPDGTTAVWMYELPAGADEALTADLNESAKLRHAEWMKAWSAARAGRATP